MNTLIKIVRIVFGLAAIASGVLNIGFAFNESALDEQLTYGLSALFSFTIAYFLLKFLWRAKKTK